MRPINSIGRLRLPSASLGVAALVGALLVGGCGPAPTLAPSISIAPREASFTPQPTTASGPVPSPGETPSGSTAPPSAGGAWDPPNLALAPLVDGLEAPLWVGAAGDGSGRLFVLEQAGRVRVVRDGRLLDQPFLDLTGKISAGGERGLLGLAFSPAYGRDGRFYVDYTDPDGNTVIAEFGVSTDPDRAEPASERILLHIDQPYPNHNGGGIVFGPDGQLWIGMGDGGSAGDPQGRGQRRDVLLGKILRVDPHQTGTSPYAVPADNPFIGQAGARPEIWALGLRNPWRFSFDRATGDLWIGDVGQGQWEEVDRLSAGTGGGANLGWNIMEGGHCFEPASGCPTEGLVLPMAEYDHSQGCAITGGVVYRGAALPALVGTYLFADYCSGRLWGIPADGDGLGQPRLLADTGRSIAGFGEDEAGEVYLADLGGGAILRLVADGG